jgi:uncharacterized membrane protein YtjA (UPF0391 family)
VFFTQLSFRDVVDCNPPPECDDDAKGEDMLHYSILFLIVALVAAFLGFGLVAGTAALLAKICFVVFLVLFIVSLLTGRGKTTV